MTEQKQVIEIVLPCFNPPVGWHTLLLSEIAALQNRFPEYRLKVILVNDGSAKGIAQAQIDDLQSRMDCFAYIDLTMNKGKGYALRSGFENTGEGIMLFTDIDFPYTTDSTAGLINKLLRDEADIIVGSRDVEYYKNVPPFRARLSRIVKKLVQKTISLPVSDTQCGLKGFNGKGKQVFLKTTINRYLFDVEFLYLASKDKSISIKTTEAKLKEGVVFSKMNLKILITEGFNFLKILAKR